MTWSDATESIGRELHRLMAKQAEWIGAEDLLPDDESDVRAVRDLRRLDAETRETIDGAVREFARSSKWPPLSMECRYILSRRLFCALDLLHALSLPTGRPLVPEPAVEGEKILVWLLNTTWRPRADRWLLAAGSLHLPPGSSDPEDFQRPR